MIKAVTFDLWDTMIHDDSDEATRKARGLRSKRAERRHLLWEALNAVEPIGAERVDLAYDVADAAFNHVWHDLFVTWTIEERLGVVLEGLGRALPEAAFAKGWFRTGDLAVRHPDGYIEIKDRSKDVIISGGENISSLEVEEALYRHPKVLEAAVVARPDEIWGESPCAFVTLKDGNDASAEEIIDFCRDRLAHFKAPKHVVFGVLPKTSTGKIQKFVLRERARELESRVPEP